MKQFLIFSVIICLLIIFWACSKDSNPVTSSSKVFDAFALWDTAGMSIGNAVQCLAAKDTFIFAGTSNNGVYRSTNNGKNWAHIITGMPTNISALLVKDSNIFAGTNSGVYLSTNNGSTWAISGITSTYIYSLVRKDTNIFAGTSNAVFRSTDNGLTWNAAGSFSSAILALAVKGSRLFAGNSGSGVFRSPNNGASWDTINYGYGIVASHVYSIAAKDTNLFAAEDGGVYRSSNDSSWTKVNEGLYAPISGGALPTSFFAYGSNILVGLNNFEGVYLSLNNGASWVSCNAGLTTNFSALAFVYNGSYLFVGGINQGAGGGVWRHPL